MESIPETTEEIRRLRAKPEGLLRVAQLVTVRECSNMLRLQSPVIHTGFLDAGEGSFFSDKAAYSVFFDSGGRVLCGGAASVVTEQNGDVNLEVNTYIPVNFDGHTNLDWGYDGQFILGYTKSDRAASYSVPTLQDSQVVMERRTGDCQVVFDLLTGESILSPEGAAGVCIVYGGLPSLASESGVVVRQAFYDQDSAEWVWHDAIVSMDVEEIKGRIEEFLTVEDSELNEYIRLHSFTGKGCGWHGSYLNTESDRISSALGIIAASRVTQLRSGCQQALSLGYMEDRCSISERSCPSSSTWQGKVLGVQLIPVRYSDEFGNEMIRTVGIAYLGMRFLSESGTLSRRLVLPFDITFRMREETSWIYVGIDCSASRQLLRWSEPESNPYRKFHALGDFMSSFQRQIGDVVSFNTTHGHGFQERADALLLLFFRVYLNADFDQGISGPGFPYLNQVLDTNRIYEPNELQDLFLCRPSSDVQKVANVQERSLQ